MALVLTGLVGGGLYLLFRKFVGGASCRSRAELDGKTVIITGGNTGIGLETAVDLAKRKARVILACRSAERGEAAVEVVKERSENGNVVYVHLDLGSLESVREFAAKILKEEPRIDILINNAGVSCLEGSLTVDGFEKHLGINHLGHFLLTHLLLDRIKEAPSGRIIHVSAKIYSFYDSFDFEGINSIDASRYSTNIVRNVGYAQSKIAQILFTRSLARQLEGTRVTVNVLYPGIIYTELGRETVDKIPKALIPLLNASLKMIIKTPKQGAQTTIYCAVAEELEGVSGKYFEDCQEKELQKDYVKNKETEDRLWQVSAEMVGLIKTETQGTLTE